MFVYADNAATTCVSKTAREAMMPYLTERYGNPSSLYRLGQEAAEALQKADRYCDMLLFPEMNHSINGCDARALVYGRMLRYFSDNL